MGHHISKQQNRQMSDEHQRMNHTKIHLEPTTSANQVKSNSLTHKLKTKKHLKQPNNAKIDIGNKDKTPKCSANNLTKSHECSAGSVVITIRLLKMETNTKDIETITNMNALENGSVVHLATDNSETINNNETSNISYDNDKHLNNNNNNNNNLCENIDKKTIQSTTFDSLNENSDFLSMFNQTNEMNNKNSLSSVQCNRINSLSEHLNCDTISANISSLFDGPDLLMPSDSELGLDNIESSTPTPTSTSTSTSQQTAILAEPTISQKILREFFPSGLISTVSPYPHHIPIANIVKSECNNSDTSQHQAQSHSKAHGNCCNKQTITTHKDAKETKTKKPNWSIKFNCTKLKGSGSPSNTTNESSESNSNATTTTSHCTNSFNELTSQASALVLDKSTVFSTNGGNVFVVTMDQRQLDLARLTPDEYAIDEDCDKKARIQRAIEIAEGVEPPPGFISTKSVTSFHSMTTPNSQLIANSVNSTNDTNGNNAGSKINAQQWHMLCSNPQTLRLLNDFHNLLQTTDDIPRIHSQVDYIHCLVPDLKQITNCSYYWGKMDRYEAERLLENKPEGTFLLRDSAQEEFLFSVSFRKYGRSLHARVEQFNHNFSFDAHDPGVYTANTVTGLVEHYKDPACVMFFEPALTLPLNRKFVYSLQQLCRATIVSHTTYDGINEICLPRKLKSYLKEYHYRQRVKVHRFDESN